MTDTHHILTALRAAGEPTRLRILAILAKGERTVSELKDILVQSQPRISRHLKLLAEAGLIHRYPEGSWVFYRLAINSPYEPLLAYLVDVTQQDAQTIRDYERLNMVREARKTRVQKYFAANAAQWNDIRARYIPETKIEAEMSKFFTRNDYDLIVDLGTGTGRMLDLFAPHTRHAIGYDTSPDMLAIARMQLEEKNLHHCEVRQADITTLPLESKSADMVILHHVLHYLDEPIHALGEAMRILKPGGYMLLVDFAPHDLEFLRDDHAHRRLGFADAEVKTWLTHIGLTPKEVIKFTPKATMVQKLIPLLWVAERSA